MKFNLPSDFDKEEINLNYLKDVIPAQLFLRVFYKQIDGKLRPLSAEDIDVENRHITSQDEVTTVLKQMSKFEDLKVLYGKRLTSLSSTELYNFVDTFCFTNAYKYGNMLLTEMQTYGMIDNYDKNSEITTSFLGKEFNDVAYVGKEKNDHTSSDDGNETNVRTGSEKDTSIRSGSETDTLTKSGSEKDTSIKSGSETSSNGLVQTTSKNATNNSQNLTVSNKVANSGDDTTTYNNVKDETTKTFNDYSETDSKVYNNVKDEQTILYEDVSDSKTHSYNVSGSDTKTFENREDNSTRSFENRQDIVIEKTHGNIGVTTTAQMLQGERELSDFSTFKIMYEDIVKSISVML